MTISKTNPRDQNGAGIRFISEARLATEKGWDSVSQEFYENKLQPVDE